MSKRNRQKRAEFYSDHFWQTDNYNFRTYNKNLDLLLSLEPAFIEKNSEAAYHLGATYYQLNQWENAQKYLSQAAEEQKPARKLLKKIQKQTLQGKN